MSEASVKDSKLNEFVQGVLGHAEIDEVLDKEPHITTGQAARYVVKSLALLADVKGLFTTKVLIQLILFFPTFLLPWMGKIVTDNVLLSKEIGTTEVRYPPFMNPILEMVEGKDPLQIMVILTTIYVVMLFAFGTRAFGTFTGLHEGKDAATKSENQISDGWSKGGGLLGVAEVMVAVRMTQHMANNLRTRLFHRLTHLPMKVLDDQRIGDSIYRVLYDAAYVPSLTYSMTIIPVFYLISAIVNLYLLQYSYGEVAPELVWIAWIMFPVCIIVTFPLSAIIRRTNQNMRAAGARTTNAMEESLNNIGAVQSLGGSKKETQRVADNSGKAFQRERYSAFMGLSIDAVAGGVFGLAGLYVTILFTNRVIEGIMTPGDFAVLFGIYSGIAGSVFFFGVFWLELQRNIVAIRRVLFFVEYETEEDREVASVLAPISEGVTFENVSFAYDETRNALSDIDLELSMGQLVAFVGPTGAGKTSLAYMIPSLLTPTEGRVLIDGEDVSTVDLDSLRNQVTYVFQEHLLLSESIRSNMLLANPDASDSDIMSALETAGCMDFVEQLPDGIDTVLGRSGDTLSVGQQQRLSIARGLVRDAKILILDEPTAALDPHTENQLVLALQKAAEGRLVIVIAHRLSTIRQADKIVFLEDGSIHDVGSHEELMTHPDGPYRQFVELQNG